MGKTLWSLAALAVAAYLALIASGLYLRGDPVAYLPQGFPGDTLLRDWAAAFGPHAPPGAAAAAGSPTPATAAGTAYLGLHVSDNQELRVCEIISVDPGSPAAQAGLQARDVVGAIESAGGVKQIKQCADFYAAQRQSAPGSTVGLGFARAVCTGAQGSNCQWQPYSVQLQVATASCPPPFEVRVAAPGNRIRLRMALAGPRGKQEFVAIFDTGASEATLPDSLLRAVGLVPYNTGQTRGVVPNASATAFLYRIDAAQLQVADAGQFVPIATGQLQVVGVPGLETEPLIGPTVLRQGLEVHTSGSSVFLTPPCLPGNAGSAGGASVQAAPAPTPPGSQAVGAPPTQLIEYLPPETWQQQALGTCEGPSAAIQRPNAYHCNAEGRSFDPCFALKGVETAVVCPPEPLESGPVVRIDLMAPLSSGPDGPGNLPWVVQLNDGQACSFLSDPTRNVGDRRLNYACKDGRWILGFAKGNTWYAETVPPLTQWPSPDNPGPILYAAVKAAWR